MERRNLIGSLLAGIGVMFTGFTRALAAPGGRPGATPDVSGSAAPPATGTSPHATVRVIYANATQSSWEAVTDGGILVAGATAITPGNALVSNAHIIHDAITAIAAAGGPTLTRSQVALFGGQN